MSNLLDRFSYKNAEWYKNLSEQERREHENQRNQDRSEYNQILTDNALKWFGYGVPAAAGATSFGIHQLIDNELKSLDPKKEHLATLFHNAEFQNILPDLKGISPFTDVPEFGTDIGGFYRRNETLLSDPNSKLKKIYTVVPSANSLRFGNQILPELIDSIYSNPSIKPVKFNAHKPTHANPFTANLPESTTHRDVSTHDLYRQFREKKLDIDGQIELLNRIDPNQGKAESVSSTLWGTISEHPRTEYATIRQGQIASTNPEVVVSYVDLDPKLQTKYLLTPEAATPYINRFSDPPGEYRTGPHWGAVEGEVKAGTRRKKDISGDVSFSSNLIRRRGALPLSVIQAIQKENGLPVTRGYGRKALDEGLRSLQSHFGLSSTGDVVDRFAVNVPRLGRTTNPRQVSQWNKIELIPGSNGSVELANGIRGDMDLKSALINAGYDITPEGLNQLNENIGGKALKNFRNFQKLKYQLPSFGALAGGLADPDAARLLARSYALKDSNPEESRLKLREGATKLGINSSIGSVIGFAGGKFLSQLGQRFPDIAAAVARRRAVLQTGGLVTTGAGLYTLADAVTEGLTGKGLTVRGAEAFREHVSPYIIGANPQQMIEQLFPTPRAVPANTPNGVAEIRPWTPPVGPVERIQQAVGGINQQLGKNVNRYYTELDRVFGGILPGGTPRRGDRRADGDIYVDKNWGYQNPETAQRFFSQQRQTQTSRRPQPGTTTNLGGQRGAANTGKPETTRPTVVPQITRRTGNTFNSNRPQSSSSRSRPGQNSSVIDMREILGNLTRFSNPIWNWFKK